MEIIAVTNSTAESMAQKMGDRSHESFKRVNGMVNCQQKRAKQPSVDQAKCFCTFHLYDHPFLFGKRAVEFTFVDKC